jgi:hypothetical protein
MTNRKTLMTAIAAFVASFNLGSFVKANKAALATTATLRGRPSSNGKATTKGRRARSQKIRANRRKVRV